MKDLVVRFSLKYRLTKDEYYGVTPILNPREFTETVYPEGFKGTVCSQWLGLQNVESVPSGLKFKVGKWLGLDSIEEIPENTVIETGGHLHIKNVKVIKKGVKLDVGGNLYGLSVETLPENLTINVKGDCYLSEMKTLPKGLQINCGGDLYMANLNADVAIVGNIGGKIHRKLHVEGNEAKHQQWLEIGQRQF